MCGAMLMSMTLVCPPPSQNENSDKSYEPPSVSHNVSVCLICVLNQDNVDFWIITFFQSMEKYINNNDDHTIDCRNDDNDGFLTIDDYRRQEEVRRAMTVEPSLMMRRRLNRWRGIAKDAVSHHHHDDDDHDDDDDEYVDDQISSSWQWWWWRWQCSTASLTLVEGVMDELTFQKYPKHTCHAEVRYETRRIMTNLWHWISQKYICSAFALEVWNSV